MKAALERFLAWFTGQPGEWETPALNCRKDDIAVYASIGVWLEHEATKERHYLVKPGTVVQCSEAEVVEGKPGWVLAEPIPYDIKFSTGEWHYGKVTAISDDVLKPIRDPGDDAIDEIIQRIGKPDEVRTPAFIGQGE